MQWLPRALPWFHFFLQWLCVWHLGSLLPVKIPALSTVLELLANSSVHYRPSLLEQRKENNEDAPLGSFSVTSGGAGTMAACPGPLHIFIKCTKFNNVACPLANTF